MICRGEKFFISVANRVDLLVEEPEMLSDNRFFYFVYEFIDSNVNDSNEMWDIEYDLENGIVHTYWLTGEYLNIYTDTFEIYTPQVIPSEKSFVVLPKGVDYKKYNLVRIDEGDSLSVDKIVFNYSTGYVEYYIQVYSDYGGKVETKHISENEFLAYLKKRNFE